MRLLSKQPWVRLIRRGLLAVLAVLLLVVAATAQDEQVPDDDPAPGPESSEGQEAEPLPDIRRRAPRTDEEEQRYKLFKFQTDPFLMPPPPHAGAAAYSPFDWLRPCNLADISTFIVQDKSGAVIGNLTIVLEQIHGDEAGNLVRLTMRHDYRKGLRTVTLVKPRTLEPVGYSQWFEDAALTSGDPGPDSSPGRLITLDTSPNFKADYLFDRVSVERNDAGFISRAVFRQLPYAFEQSALNLLVRQLDFRNPNWPFEAVITNPRAQASHQLLIVKPNRISTMSAEPRTYNCFELSVQLNNEKSRWWVERIAPNRLVKFTHRDLTYTLVGHLEQ